MRLLTVAATQMSCDWDIPGNLDRAEGLVREAAAKGAKLILLQELFETPYFCQDQLYEFLDLAAPFEGNKPSRRSPASSASCCPSASSSAQGKPASTASP